MGDSKIEILIFVEFRVSSCSVLCDRSRVHAGLFCALGRGYWFVATWTQI